MKVIYELWIKRKESLGSDMVKVDMTQLFRNLVLNVVIRIISGKRFLQDDEEGVRFQNAIKKFNEFLF